MTPDDDGAEERLDPLEERSGEHEREMRTSHITARPASSLSLDSERPPTGRIRFEADAALRGT
jgi:hypothetical protein